MNLIAKHVYSIPIQFGLRLILTKWSVAFIRTQTKATTTAGKSAEYGLKLNASIHSRPNEIKNLEPFFINFVFHTIKLKTIVGKRA